ncbi:MAG: ABC transporter permease, partial [Bacteroidales bacterium]
MKAFIIRILQQIRNDKRTLALLLFAPLLVMTLVYFLLGNSDYKGKIGIYNIPAPLTSILKKKTTITELTDTNKIDKMLKKDSVDAVLWMEGTNLRLRILESNSKTAIAVKAIQESLSELMPMGSFKIEMLYGSPDDNMFDSLAFVFLGFLSFFFTFIVAGMALVRERFSQTLERVFTTPVRRYQIVGGYMLGYGILTAVQGLLIILFAIYVLEVPLAGSLWLCILVMVLLAFTAVATGALVSIFANSEFQVVQFIPIVVIPQVFFTGLIPLETIPYGLGKLCYLMPV